MNSSINSASSQLPVIAGHEITVDQHGRFNLGALHKAHLEISAAPNRSHKQPSDWAKLSQTRDLIEELANSEDLRNSDVPLIESRKGRYGGTFAHELLAISYAGWISPKFQLQVNQVFLDYRTGKLKAAEQQKALPNPLSPRHQRELQKAIASRVYAQVAEAHRPSAFKRLYSHLKDRFEVGSYKDIDDSRYTEALGAVQSFVLDGDWIEAKPREDGATFTDDDISDLYILLCHVDRVCRKWREYDLYDALRRLQSPAAAEMCESVSMANAFKDRLVRNKGDLMEVSRRRLGVSYGLLPTA